MRIVNIIGLALGVTLVCGMVMSNGASAYSLIDRCTTEAENKIYKDGLCKEPGPPDSTGWLEVLSGKSPVSSLLVLLELKSGGITLDCEDTLEGAVGPGASNEITKLIDDLGMEVTEAKPTTMCKVTEGGSLCTESAQVSLDGLPWLAELIATGD